MFYSCFCWYHQGLCPSEPPLAQYFILFIFHFFLSPLSYFGKFQKSIDQACSIFCLFFPWAAFISRCSGLKDLYRTKCSGDFHAHIQYCLNTTFITINLLYFVDAVVLINPLKSKPRSSISNIVNNSIGFIHLRAKSYNYQL